MTRRLDTPAPLPPTGPMLSALRVVHVERWQEVTRAALSAQGTVPDAARALGVNAATLRRWLRECPALGQGIQLRGRGRPVRAVKRKGAR